MVSSKSFYHIIFIITVLFIVTEVSARSHEKKGYNVLTLSKNLEVIDGDTIKDGKDKIRLYGVDAPELRQKCQNKREKDYSCGEEAKNKLKQLIKGKTVKCRVKNLDKYQRKVSVCYVGDMDVNRKMVQEGYAVVDYKYSDDYEMEEEIAIYEKKGIWQGEFEEPRDYRRRLKNNIEIKRPKQKKLTNEVKKEVKKVIKKLKRSEKSSKKQDNKKR